MLPFERQELIKTLSDLPNAQFEQVLFTLNPPGGVVPTANAPQGERVAALLAWVEKTGPGLNKLQAVLHEVLGKERLELPTVCPYKGLSYFDRNDEDYKYFYGRETLTQTLLEKVSRDSFLAIVGASGSGKSSVLRAGLLQRLKDKGDSEIRILEPGEHPRQSLARAFIDKDSDRLDRAAQQAKAEALISVGSDGLRRLVQNSDAKRVVLVVDQFEESFTLCQDKNERQAFFETLLGGLESIPSKLILILAMRSDFVGKCFEDNYGRLAAKIKSYFEPVLPMTVEEITKAIEEPARQTGLSLEPGLTKVLLRDLKQSFGGLPFLQYTLTELWKRQRDNQLKLSAYHQLGGVMGTLKQRADEVYKSLTTEQQQTAKHIFLSLTQLGEGAEDTRRRITQDSLVSSQYSETQITELVKRFADNNLVVTDSRGEVLAGKYTATVEVVHEVLIQNWPKLKSWLDESRDSLRQQRKIELAAEEWSKQSPKVKQGYLLQGRPLTDAKLFAKTYGRDFPLTPMAEQFLKKSLDNRRSNRLSLIGMSTIVPLGFAAYAGLQATTYFSLKPHWDLIYSYDPVNNVINGAQFVGALEKINDKKHSLSKVFLLSADLSDADLHEANFYDATLQKTILRNANLYSANLRKANLNSADLSYAKLDKAILENTDFENAVLYSTDLSHAQNFAQNQFNEAILCRTILPEDIILNPNRDWELIEDNPVAIEDNPVSSPPISEQQAVQIVQGWLDAKAMIFAPPFDESSLRKYIDTTSETFEQIKLDGGAMGWLKTNNYKYVYNFSNITEILEFEILGPGKVSMVIQLHEDLELYDSNRNVVHDSSGEEINTFRYILTSENGDWKIHDYYKE